MLTYIKRGLNPQIHTDLNVGRLLSWSCLLCPFCRNWPFDLCFKWNNINMIIPIYKLNSA